jgi:hypothetical protein
MVTLNIHTIYKIVFKIWRKRRMNMFLDALAPASGDVLLDIGGYPGCWTDHPQPVARIDILNVHEIPWNPARAPRHNIRTLVGDGCALDIGDGAYNIVFSNSVIEHVGSWERQKLFAAEARRVGQSVWVQAPAYACPVEPHYLALFIHYLPVVWRKRLARRFTLWGWLQRPNKEQVAEMAENTRLLTKKEMKTLFPDCKIYTERMLGFIPKSYIAVRRP